MRLIQQPEQSLSLSMEQFEELGKFQASEGRFDLRRLKPFRKIARMAMQSEEKGDGYETQ